MSNISWIYLWSTNPKQPRIGVPHANIPARNEISRNAEDLGCLQNSNFEGRYNNFVLISAVTIKRKELAGQKVFIAESKLVRRRLEIRAIERANQVVMIGIV